MARNFDAYDYLVFAGTLIISMGIGVFFAFHKGGQTTTKQFLLGDRQLPILPTALSILVSFYSGISVLGVPSEVYMKGTQYIWYIFGIIAGIPLACYIYMPIFYRLKLTSAYEYLELRYRSVAVRRIGSVLYLCSTLMYMAIVLYAPATALSAVSNMNEEMLIAVIGAVCTFYTCIGGLKAVVWTDAFQGIMMYIGLLSVIIQGTIDVGGPSKVYQVLEENGRITNSFSVDPFMYMNFWTVFFGTSIGWMSTFGMSQGSVQRYCSLSTIGRARMSLLLCIPGAILMVPLFFISGAVMFAFYAHCDPLLLKEVSARDQLLPYFTTDVLAHVKGLPGIFLSCLFSGTLSTVSTGLNSAAAVVWEDFLKVWLKNVKLSEQKSTRINKLLVIIFGIAGVCLAYTAQFFGGVLQGAWTVLSAIGSPLAGLFVLGILFPWANSKGAIAGVFSAFGIIGWICIGAQYYKPYRESLPRSIAGCDNDTLISAAELIVGPNISYVLTNLTAHLPASPTNPSLTGISYIYRLSYKLYGLVSISIVLIVGIVVSLLTGGHIEEIDHALIWPGWYQLCCCLPERYRDMLAPPKFNLKKSRRDSQSIKAFQDSDPKTSESPTTPCSNQEPVLSALSTSPTFMNSLSQ